MFLELVHSCKFVFAAGSQNNFAVSYGVQGLAFVEPFNIGSNYHINKQIQQIDIVFLKFKYVIIKNNKTRQA